MQDQEKSKKGDIQLGTMQPGDYMVHVYLQKGKNFTLDDTDGPQTFNALVQVSSSGKSEYSKCHSDCQTESNSPLFLGEHFFFEPRNMSSEDIQSQNVTIKVLDKRFFKDTQVGQFEIDLAQIYFSNDQHVLEHQWVALNNPDSVDPNSIKGYIQMSIAVQGPGDSTIKLTDSDGSKDEETEVMMPASIRKKYKQIVISILQAENFVKMDYIGNIEPYLEIERKKKKKLQMFPIEEKKEDKQFIFNQSFKLACQWPPTTDKLEMKVMDKDRVSNDTVGHVLMSVRDIVENYQEGRLIWQNIYGAPTQFKLAGLQQEELNAKSQMNQNPEMASLWKGRLLMHIKSSEEEAPEHGISNMSIQEVEQMQSPEFMQLKNYEIIAEVGSGICLPKNKAYKVRISMANFSMDTDKAQIVKASQNVWNQRFEQFTIQAPYNSLEEINRIYFYLMDGDTPICYWKGKITDFQDKNPKFKWYSLVNDEVIGQVDEQHEAGMIQVKFSINDLQKNPQTFWNKYPAWQYEPTLNFRKMVVRCFIFQCKELPSADSVGAQDQFLQVWNANNSDICTNVLYDCINPIFCETLEVEMEMQSIETGPPIILNLFDEDKNIIAIKSRDFLSRAVIPLDSECVVDYSNMTNVNQKPPKPTWQPLRPGSDQSLPESGYVLCSFILADKGVRFANPANEVRLGQMINTQKMEISIQALGLRHLESFGLMPIRKPFIKLRTKSLLPPEKAQAVTDIQTVPKEMGPNANINKTIAFSVDLPVEKIFCPVLTCEAYDYICKGFSQPKIGTFTINLGEIMNERAKQDAAHLKKADKYISILKDILDASIDGEGVHLSQREKMALSFGVELQEDSEFDRSNQKHSSMDLEDEEINLQNESSFLIQKSDDGNKPSDRINTNDLIKKIVTSAVDQAKQKIMEKEMIQLYMQASLPDADSFAIKTFENQIMDLRQKRERMRSKTRNRNSVKQNKVLKIMEGKLLASLRLKQIELKKQKKNEQSSQRMSDLFQMIDDGVDPDVLHSNILLPKYSQKPDSRLKVFRESYTPPTSIFMAVGYDGTVTEENPPPKRKRHYRKFHQDELENNKELFSYQPFTISKIFRGQEKGLKNSFLQKFMSSPQGENPQLKTSLKQVGIFKSFIQISNLEQEDEYIDKKIQKLAKIEQLLQQIHNKKFGKEIEIEIENLVTRDQKHDFQHLLMDMGAYSDEFFKFLIRSNFETYALQKQLEVQTHGVVRLYMLEGFDFASRDFGSFSDPYLKVICGTKVIDEREKYQIDEPNPKFYSVYEICQNFPGSAPLIIEAYDFDDFFGDELIGKTSIDLDERFFSPEWRALMEKPIEYRELYHPSTSLAQGTVICWLDIQAQNKSRNSSEPWDITPEPSKDYQLRVAIYDTENVPMEDAEGTSDVFVKAWIDDNDQKETDTHWRCSNGSASFNYRLLFDFKSPSAKPESEAYKLKLALYDRDIFRSNDFLCKYEINLRLLVQDCRISKKSIHLSQKYYTSYYRAENINQGGPDIELEFLDEDSFWLSVKKDRDSKPIKLRLDIRVLPGDLAEAQKVGVARVEPNNSPKLTEPFGRIQMTANPFSLIGQLLGPDLKRRIQAHLCLILVVAALIVMTPMIVSNIISQGIVNIF